MSEAIEMKEPAEAVETAKPYTFRKLSAEDMFLMFRIIKKIGVNEFKKCFEGETLETLVTAFKNSGGDEKALTAVGVSIGFDLVDLILGNLPKCEKEIYQLLAQVSGMTEDEVKKDMILFTEMVIDFVKKDEFPGFFKVVSRLFK
jgi:hypothetical protein